MDRILWELSKLSRIRFWYLATKINIRVLTAFFILFASLVSITIMGIAAHLTSWMFVFPSIGPSAFLIFYAPSSAMSCPRNTILGHFIGAVVGLLSFKLITKTLGGHLHPEMLKIFSAAVALGISGMIMVLTNILHPPAASSCLIAALGLVENIYQIGGMMAAVIFLCIQGYIMNKLAGIKYPIWYPIEEMPLPKIKTILGDLSEPEKAKDHVEEIAAKLATRRKIKK